MPKSIVAVKFTDPSTVLDDIPELIKTAKANDYLDRDNITILKDNISWHFPYLSANTTPWQLEGTIRGLHDLGYKKIAAVHNNTVVTDPDKGIRMNKLDTIYKEYQIEEHKNCDKNDLKWIEYQPKAKMRVLHDIFRRGIRIPEYFFGKNIVHLPTLKTHIYTTTTGAMKNAFGGLLNTKRHYTHSVIHETLVDLLAIQKEIHSGLFAVMDGTICGTGPGPRTMTPVEENLVLASADQVAIDAVAAKLMGFDPMQILFIRLAHEQGLGIGSVNDIDVEGEDISGMNFQFSVGDNFASRIGDLLWFSPLKTLQKLFFHTPLVYVFVMGSYLYHDFIWWPTWGKQRQRRLRKQSQWARYFDSYPLNSR